MKRKRDDELKKKIKAKQTVLGDYNVKIEREKQEKIIYIYTEN